MTVEEFERAVLDRLQGYRGDVPPERLREHLEEYADIVRDGYRDPYGEEHGVAYAAWNISQCI